MTVYDFTYKGAARINNTLSYKGLDEQLRKLEGFETVFTEEMTPAVEEAVNLAAEHAREDLTKKIKGKAASTGELAGSIYGKMLSPDAKYTVRGRIGTGLGIKAFSNEVGRWYKNQNRGRWHLRGKYYLYFGAADKAAEIRALYEKANERMVNRLVVTT